MKLSRYFIDKLKDNIIHKLGYGENKRAPLKIERALDDALTAAEKVAEPKGIYCFLPVLGTSRSDVQTDAGIIRSVMFSRLVTMCRGDCSIVCMIATLGMEVERVCGSDEPLYRQLMFDTVGSNLAEVVADMLEIEWRKEADSRGMQYSWRFSPGYCDWGLEGQSIIFRVLDAGSIGVRITTPYSVMAPSKSISAVAIIAEEVPSPAPCVLCAKKNCATRRVPWNGEGQSIHEGC